MEARCLPEIGDLLDQQLQSIFPRMTGLTLWSAPEGLPPGEDAWSLAISAKGDCRLTFLLCAQWTVWYDIARYMNHGKAVPEENVFLYVGELFNVLCGRVLSAINARYRCSARFSVPQVLRGVYASRGHDYQCDCGAVKLAVAEGPGPWTAGDDA